MPSPKDKVEFPVEEENHEPTRYSSPQRDAPEDHAPDHEGDSGENDGDNASVSSSEQERREIAELEKRLPRPEWYSSDDEQSDESSEEAIETTDMTKPQEGGLVLLIVYTALCLIAFVFSLAATCPIPWMKAKHGGRKYGIWAAKGGGQPRFTVRSIHDCSNEQQYWMAASAFSVISTLVCFGALISGLCLCFGKGHIGASMILSFYGMVFSLVSWSLVAALFNYRRCNKGKYSSFARLDAGFALMLIAFVFMLFSIIVMAMQFATYYTKSIHGGIVDPMRFIYIALLSIALLFGSVGPAFTQWSKSFPLIKAKVTMWHVELYDKETHLSTFLGRKQYQCSTFTRRMKVVAAFNIMSNTWLAVGLLLAIAACYNDKVIRHSNILGWAGALFSLVAWLVLVVTRHGHLCTTMVLPGESIWHDMGYNGVPSGVHNAQIVFDGYGMREGFALMVTGWAINIIATLLNTIF